MTCVFCQKPFTADPWMQPVIVPAPYIRRQAFAHKGCLADYEYEMAYDRQQSDHAVKVQSP